MISFYIVSKSFSLKCKGLADGKVASITKKEYGVAVLFMWKLVRSLRSISDEWFNVILLSSHLHVKKCVEFSLMVFGTAK